jgi:hypothetical protein
VDGDVDVVVVLPPPLSARAKVVDAAGTPVAGATVRVYVVTEARARPTAEAVTADDGMATLVLPNP